MKSLFAFGVLMISSVLGTTVTTPGDCPALTPRTSPPVDITDLRPDDIKVLGALGDSIMAGYVMMGVSGPLDIKALEEFRGHSYAIGGDSGAITLPNIMNHYTPVKKGPSVGTTLATTCNIIADTCSSIQYTPSADQLNGALSGAMSFNLQTELGYVLSQMKSISGIDVQNDWKMITIQIGSNDQCASCNSTHASQVTADQYGANIENAILTIKNGSPRTIVNLVGVFNVSQVFPLSQKSGLNYCVMTNNDPSTIRNLKECSCSADSNHQAMDELAASYNVKLQALAEKYKAQPNGTFAVVYRPANVNIMSFPIDALSNYDCFHPSQKGHEWMAKIYCPTDTDRIQLS
ncbi:uncharacterized protein BX664DRAFT_266357 [Halteromyces radiatus]|uniref:uncharacterized protein n=1 Tax=Halteromyces radiatus TaxID=101107 RepID=UPI002220DCDC|nr:uncharacterized protein BX664DRAFT_266357 [Halteromyces radiatus]KAI8084633.1 hypothetical protein BX664DRAFT_266357 [Halteromyces radiatus]